MFSNDQLSALSQLKQDIRASRDIAQGVVRATSGRFGFVTLDDGRDAFLTPEQMEHVFPGDRVEIEVITNKKEQFEAKLEKLIESPIRFLSGRYQVRGKGHFVATDLPHFSRWIFVPPKQRAKCKAGDWVSAKITQHPFKDGRAQARITNNIGNEQTPHIERLYAIGKYQLNDSFSKEVTIAAKQLSESPLSIESVAEDAKRQDLRHIPFITIDSAATRDMDDALAIQKSDNGWLLSVAIADPSADIAFNSVLDKTARKRAQTTYFADKPLTMLPSSLSIERYSLKPGEDRLSLIFQCEIDNTGHVNAFTFIPAIIQSHAKMSYAQVAALLNNEEYKTLPQLTDPKDFQAQLEALQACAHALKSYRKENYIVIENKADFALCLNEKGKLQRIEKTERNIAHSIVEEAMLITNRCAGDFLARHNTGLFVRHMGYRNERRADIEALLSEKTKTEITSTQELDHYIKAIKTLQSDETYSPLLTIQQHFLEPSKISDEPSPHFGLGFHHYATVTSPIRRYQDLYNQRLIHQILANKDKETITSDELTSLHDDIKASRDASQFMNQWLISDFMKDKIGQTFTATVSLLTNQGIGVRLVETGIEGFILAAKASKKNPEITGDKVSFNNQRMELQWNGKPITLDQEVSVTLDKIDHEKKKLAFVFTPSE